MRVSLSYNFKLNKMKKFLITVGVLIASLVSLAHVTPQEEVAIDTNCCNDTTKEIESTATEEISMELFGIWQTLDNEFVQISRDMDFKISFMRVASSKALLAKGFITADSAETLSIDRTYPESETYVSQYVFSPSKKTLVIMKPNSNQAWVLHKVQ